jgi:hypothetical protein
MNTVDELLPSFEEEFKMETTGRNPENYLDREALRQNYVQYSTYKRCRNLFHQARMGTTL